MAAVRRRVWQLSSIPGFGASKLEVSSSFQRAILDPFPVSGTRHFSQVVKSNGKHLFLVDTLALVIIIMIIIYIHVPFLFVTYLL